MNPVLRTAPTSVRIGLFVALTSCLGPAPLSAQGAGATRSNRAIVDSLAASFNRHDVSALYQWIHPEFTWLSIDGTGVSVEVQGLEALRSGLFEYFESLPTVRTELEGGTESGPFVSVVERVFWIQNGEERTQASTAVYEVRAGQIRRVWYYPEVR